MKKPGNRIKELLSTENYKFLFYFIILSMVFSCKDDVVPPVELIARAGANQQVKLNETVTLDGTGSTGPQGFTYAWTYQGEVPESEINFQNKNSAKPTFVPPADNVYSFTLTISYDGSTVTDQTTVLAGGSIELGGTLTMNLQLKNIQPDATKPDYIVNSDLIVPDGITLSVVESDVRIEFQNGSGLHIASGGRFTNVKSNNVQGYETDLYASDGWKGILVDNGDFFLNNSKITNAGAKPFAGQAEAAALTFIGQNTRLLEVRKNEFVNSQSYDLMCLEKVGGTGMVAQNIFSYKHPMKISTGFLGFFSPGLANTYPESHEYSIIIPGGATVKDMPYKQGFLFPPNGNYYIDGDFWAGEQIWMEQGNINIYMKEGSAILAEKKISGRVFPDKPIVIEGLDGAQWKGIASLYDNVTADFEFQNVTIKNAGYGLIKIGTYEAEAEAALRVQGGGFVQDFNIINSGGYGVYNAAKEFRDFDLKRAHFENTRLPAVRTIPQSVGINFRQWHDCSFDLEPGLAACLVEGEGVPQRNLYMLGGDNFYLIDANILDGDHFTINPGVIMKFKSGRSLVRTNNEYNFSVRGLSGEPIILDGEAGTPGSWGGVFLGGNRFGFEHVIIKNGGEFVLPGATEKANVVSAAPDAPNDSREMIHTTISNSAGYGIVVEANTLDYDYENPEHENVFENNGSGNVVVKQ